jgi:hypothetical protein
VVSPPTVTPSAVAVTRPAIGSEVASSRSPTVRPGERARHERDRGEREHRAQPPGEKRAPDRGRRAAEDEHGVAPAGQTHADARGEPRGERGREQSQVAHRVTP